MRMTKNGLKAAGIGAGLLASVFTLSGCNEAEASNKADQKFAAGTKPTPALHSGGGSSPLTSHFISSSRPVVLRAALDYSERHGPALAVMPNAKDLADGTFKSKLENFARNAFDPHLPDGYKTGVFLVPPIDTQTPGKNTTFCVMAGGNRVGEESYGSNSLATALRDGSIISEITNKLGSSEHASKTVRTDNAYAALNR